MAAIEVEAVEDNFPAKSLKTAATFLEIIGTYADCSFQGYSNYVDKQLKCNANRHKTTKAMVLLLARFEKAQPPRNLKSRCQSLRSSVLIYMKTQKQSFQSKATARAPLLMAAILFLLVHEHNEF